MPTSDDLIIYSNEDGAPWAAFVWGEADPAEVELLITLEEVDRQTGCGADVVTNDCTWPPKVQTYWLRESDDTSTEFDVMFEFCEADDPGATKITGHRFYPQI